MQSAGKTSSIESKVQITNTEILATPTVNPPAHLMEDARRVRDETELHDSRKSTPQGKSIPGLSAGVLNKPLLSEPHLQPSDIPLYSRRSPRIAGLNAAAVTDAPIETQSSPIAIEPELKTPAKIAPVGPKCAPKGPQRRKAASLPKNPAKAEGESKPESTDIATEIEPGEQLPKKQPRSIHSAPNLEASLAIGNLKPIPIRCSIGQPRAQVAEGTDQPHEAGHPFEGMSVCRDNSLPMLNSQSNVFFQEQYSTDQLPLQMIEEYDRVNGMDGQIEARERASKRGEYPHSKSPPCSRTEEEQLWNAGESCSDQAYLTPSGDTFYTNDTHRQCNAPRCQFLAFTKLTTHNGKPKLRLYSTCSKFCQWALARDAATMARRAGQPGRFLFPVTSTEHRMTPRAWLHWNRRYAKECKDRAAISEAFIAYRKIYGADQSAEIESLARGNPVDFDHEPVYPTYAMRTMVGPLADDPLQQSGEGHETVADGEPHCQTADAIQSSHKTSYATLHTVADASPTVGEANEDRDDASLPNRSSPNTVSLETGFSEFHQMENLEENAKSYAERKVGKSRDASKKQKLQRTKSIANIQKGEVYVPKRDRQVRYPESKNQKSEKHFQTTLKREINEELVSTDMAHLTDIFVIEKHQDSGSRIFFYSQCRNEGIPARFISLHSAHTLNPELLLSYLYVNALSKHEEVVKLGLDIQMENYMSQLELGNSPPDNSDLPKATVRKYETKSVPRGKYSQVPVSSTERYSEIVPESNPCEELEGTSVKRTESSAAPRSRPSTGVAIQIAAMEDDTQEARAEHNAAMQPSEFSERIEKKSKATLASPSKASTHSSSEDDGLNDRLDRWANQSGTRDHTSKKEVGHRKSPVSKKDRSELTKSHKGKDRERKRDNSTARRESKSYDDNTSSSESDDERRKRARTIDKFADEGTGNATSDTDDYISSSDDSLRVENVVVERRRPSHHQDSSESEKGEWNDSASDSDDSSSDSDLDVRASQHKTYRRKRALERGRKTLPSKHDRERHRPSRSRSPEEPRHKDRSRSPQRRDRSSSKAKHSEPTAPRTITTDPPWREEFKSWRHKRKLDKSNSSHHDNSDRSDRKHRGKASRKKSKKDKDRESLSSFQVEHVGLSAMLTNLLTFSDSESDREEVDSSESITEQAVLATSSSSDPSGTSHSSEPSSSKEPPKEFFDALLEQPEHIARVKESGLDRATYLEKVLRAPTKELADMYYDLAKKKYLDREKEKVPRSLQYPERLSSNAQFRPGSNVNSNEWKKHFMSECAFVKEIYLTPLCLRSALDGKVAAAVRSNFSREKFKGKYEAERSDLIPFDSVCKFLSKTYDRPGRLEAALLDYLTLSQGKGSVRDLITTRTNKIGILNRLGATPLNEDLDRALVLRALSAPLSEYIASRPHHLKYSVNEIFRIAKTREVAVNNASRTARSESLNSISKRGGTSFRNRKYDSNPRTKGNKGRFQKKSHLNAAISKNNHKRATSRHPNKASLFAYGNGNDEPRVSTRLFRTNYSEAEWNVRVGPDGKIKPGVNPKDPRHRNSFNKDTYQGKPWCLICKKPGHDMTSCRNPQPTGGKGKGKGRGNNKSGGRGPNKFRR